MTNQRKWLHGPERSKYMYIPKIIDLCLNKLYQLVEGDHFHCSDIIDGFLLNQDITKKYQYETEIEGIKDQINQGRYDLFYEHSNEPQILAQIFLDF